MIRKDLKKINAEYSTITRDMDKVEAVTGNVYESCAIIAKRSNQISVVLKEELTAKLNEFAMNIDNLEEIFENREQIEVSKFYERLPKTNAMAIKEFMEDELYFRKPEVDGEEAVKE